MAKLVSIVFLVILAVPAGYLIYQGVDMFGTPWWGYADNAPGVYYVFGTLWAAFGFLIWSPALVFTWIVWRSSAADATGA